MNIGIIPHSKPWIVDDDYIAIKQTLLNGLVSQGAKVSEFEVNISKQTGLKNIISCGSGSAAFLLILKALEIGPGLEVIVPTYVCKSVLQAITTVGATPVLCDIGNRWTITPENVEPYLTKKTAAILVVHLFGIAVDITDFKKFGTMIIEDACQSFGSKIGQEHVGAKADAGFFSFHGTKCLTTGEGGAAFFSNDKHLEMAKKIRDGAFDRVFSPMTDIQASLGISQLSRYNEFEKRRKEIGRQYLQSLKNKNVSFAEFKDYEVPFRFPIKVKASDVEKLINLFRESNISVRKGVDSLLHHHYKVDKKNFPVAEETLATTISIPLYPALTDREVERIVNSCMSILD